MAGYLELERARIRWFLSIDKKTLPDVILKKGMPVYRSMIVDKQEISFTNGFTDLHTESYSKVLAKKGFKMQEARPSIELASLIRNSVKVNLGEKHFFFSIENISLPS